MTLQPLRPVLRPGFGVLRRDDHTLQVGLYPPERALVSDTPEVRRLLDALTEGQTSWGEPTAPTAAFALATLRAAGLVLPAPGLYAEHAHAQAHGAAWASHRVARHSAQVALSGPAALTADLVAVLGAEGVCATAYAPGRDDPPAATALWVALSAGPVSRDLLDQAAGPTLSVSSSEARWEVGPFTVPGSSPCLRCVDAARCDEDPRWPLLVAQAAAAPSDEPSTCLATTRAALAVTAQEVLTWIDGHRPATWGATVTVKPHGLPVRTEWPAHPACGCGWKTHLLREDVTG